MYFDPQLPVEVLYPRTQLIAHSILTCHYRCRLLDCGVDELKHVLVLLLSLSLAVLGLGGLVVAAGILQDLQDIAILRHD